MDNPMVNDTFEEGLVTTVTCTHCGKVFYAPEAKAYCGWYPVGKFEGHDPRCREGKSAADKMQERAALAKEETIREMSLYEEEVDN